MDNTAQRLEKLIEVGIALSSERNIQRLLELILLGAKAITHADGGTLYSLQDDGTLRMDILHTDSLNFAMGGTTGKEVPFEPLPLYDSEGNPNHHNVVTHAVLNDCTVNIQDAYNTEGFDFSGTRAFDQSTGYRSTSFLTVPMKNHEGDIIGVLQLLNARAADGATVIPFDTEAQRLTEALASQAAVALTNRRLIDDLKDLFESLIKMIADSIDEKSPYTGGHCRRVPVLTMMLAESAHKVADGPLAGFAMNEDDRYELGVAAWLHDCGKITTPEQVVDKSTKLETVYDRIHTIEERYERLKLAARNRYLEARLSSLERGEAANEDREQALNAELQQLDEEQAFLRRINLGAEFMDTTDQQRVQTIASRLLIDSDGTTRPLLSADEIKNLTIARGTLTDEERQVINNHIVATINMLEALPFPKQLKRVPEYAGGHHERIDGKGYPKGLTGEQMSVQARVMAIADIFEALTARDRPYKPAKKLSESLGIMARMSEEGHIDPELFRLFVTDKIYLRYAEEYLDPEQIDTEQPA